MKYDLTPQMQPLVVGDCLEVMRGMPDKCVDLVFCSPPYESARTYGVNFKLKGDDWIVWAVERYLECVRICRGLVAWVVEGQTRNFRWSATPAILMARLHRKGVHLRKPPAFHRVGIPGSGGPDWLRNDYEFIVCGTSGGKLPWSCNTACGSPPKFAPGGDCTNRKVNGDRIRYPGRIHQDGIRGEKRSGAPRYKPPAIANPGNVINCGAAGGGNIGSKLAHENEAPFPEALAEFFIRSFCPPGGIVADPFVGSGTVPAVAEMHGRKWWGCDIRGTQIELTQRRIAEVQAKEAPA